VGCSLGISLPMNWPSSSKALQMYDIMFYLVGSHIDFSQFESPQIVDGRVDGNADVAEQFWRFRYGGVKLEDLYLAQCMYIGRGLFQVKIYKKDIIMSLNPQVTQLCF
jgi:hypothetical protein